MTIFDFKKFWRAETGVAAIEMSFILPFLLLLYFGLLDLTGLVSFNRKITAVASSVADITSQNRNTVLKANITDYMYANDMIMKPTPASKVTVKVYGYRKVGAVATLVWQTSNAVGPGCASAPNATEMLPLMAAGNDLIVTQACMKYVPYVATFMGDKLLGKTSFNVEQTVMVRPRPALQLTCYQTTVGGAVCS
jgi:Flp pilus assembly protein TadG